MLTMQKLEEIITIMEEGLDERGKLNQTDKKNTTSNRYSKYHTLGRVQRAKRHTRQRLKVFYRSTKTIGYSKENSE